MTSPRSRGGGGEDLTDPPAPKKSKPDISVIDKNPRERLLSLKNFKKAMIYLYETQDEDLVRKTMSVMPELKIVGPNTDHRLLDEAVSYCLEKSVRSHRIIFDTCTISPETEKILSPGLRKCSDLRIQHCDLTLSYQEDLLYSAVTNQSLITLNVSKSALQYKRVKHLCEGLRHLDCVVQELRLEHCGLTPFCFEELSSVITTNQSLVTLDLSNNDPQESGVKHLCAGLRNPRCKLKALQLRCCDLTSSCEDLCSVIGTSRSLIKLDLSWNKLEDFGVKRLCDGLRYGSSVMQELRLEHCDLTTSCCKDLCSVMINLPSLKTLDLSHNKLQDSGVMSLSDGLWFPGCALHELRLESCGLTSSCCEGLYYGITNRFLIKLDLSRNKLEDSGVKRLCDGLRHRSFPLQELRLEQCDLTSYCCEDLLSVITTNRSLITLDLSRNNLQVSEVKRLCEGLRDPDCVLQELRLWDCCQTPFDNKHLGSIITNQSWIMLDLSYKRLEDRTFEHLCERLRHLNWALPNLRLQHCGLTSSSCEVLRSVISTNRSLIKLDLSWNKLEDLGVKHLCEGLRERSSVLQELRLQHCGLTSSSCEDLCSEIGTSRSLIKLDLSWNKLEDFGVKRLCDGLREWSCVLRELRLEHCDLTSSCCADLCSVMIRCQSLITLDLSLNKLWDSGVKCLSDGLQHPGCVLQELRLRHCGLTSSSCEDLCSVIATSRSLIKLDLSWNKLEDLGVKRLCEGLRHRHCILQELWLEHCDLTSSCCEDLYSVMMRLRSLITLDLSLNKLWDSGVKRLCDGLQHPDCVLKELRLESCGLTSSCCEGLYYGITNGFLIKLDLSRNKLEDSGVKRLCDGLRDRSCRLQELRLERCGLTSSCCEDLLFVISTYQSLITLDLSRNNLQDSGVKRLYEALRDPDCVLQELRLWDCDQTPFNEVDLLSSLITNRSLTTLDLSYKRLEDGILQRLCEGLDRPDCVLQELRLQHCGLTSSSCEVLRSLIATSRSLIILDLSWNKLEDFGVMVLCEGLRHRHCILQELRLEHCDLTTSCCADLRSVMMKLHSLITLDLSRNKLQDSGVKRLCDGLSHPGCLLQELRLEHCDLTSSCCADLRSVMMRLRSLITLDLSHNKLRDSGVKRLCDGLWRPGCVLRELRLESCGLTSSCCGGITNRFLINLDLSRNKLDDSGVKRLCDGLRDRSCRLQELRLEHCGLTSFSFEGITNGFLLKLDLSRNKLEDSGVKRLCAGLRDRCCVLQELRLHRCNLTFSGIEYLLNTSNQSLKKLDI